MLQNADLGGHSWARGAQHRQLRCLREHRSGTVQAVRFQRPPDAMELEQLDEEPDGMPSGMVLVGGQVRQPLDLEDRRDHEGREHDEGRERSKGSFLHA